MKNSVKRDKFMKQLSISLKILFFLGMLSFVQITFAQNESAGFAAIQKAANENKHLFIFFYKDKDEKTLQLQNILNQILSKTNEAMTLSIDLNAPTEKHIIEKYKLKRSRVPTVVVIAPNGAVTGKFKSFTQNDLMKSILSSGAVKCLKALQEKKLVFLCLQNEKTSHNSAALKGINDFKNDPKFAKATEIVMINPSNTNEHEFLKQFDLNTNTSKSITLLIYPPGHVIGKYEGAVTKEQFISSIKKTTAGCPDGKCCPGGC